MDINDIKNPKPCSQCLYIYCSVIALLHICSTDVILWTAGGSENPCLSRGHIELLSHTRPLWRSLECCQQPASQLSPACVTLGKGRKRKGKQVKQILSAMVPQQTPKQDTQKKKLWQYWQYKGSTSFNMHAQDFTRACDSRRKPSQIGPLMVSIFQQNITQRYLLVQWSRRDPKIRIHLLAEVQLDPQSLWGCLACR